MRSRRARNSPVLSPSASSRSRSVNMPASSRRRRRASSRCAPRCVPWLRPTSRRARLEPAPQRAAPVEVREPAPREAVPAPQSASPFSSPQPSQPAPAARNDENGGWLRDVLRNASAKQAGNQPAPQQQGNLSGLTEEIARAIDLTALSEAWTRYQAGESNVFSRRIYTLGGQGTYDEVRKKLQRDPEFARTSQAYMAEFEQLLKRAAAGPRPAEESREYLLSDRGKVYTMLAHASGRLN